MFKVIKGGITAPKGYKAAGIHIGIRKKRKDLALIYSEYPASCGAVFTTSMAKGAPVIKDIEQIKNKYSQAIICNSGNANSCTGKKGLISAEEMIVKTAQQLNIEKEKVMVFSTGIIGQTFPIEKIKNGIEKIVPKLSVDGGEDFADAIQTTDTFIKEVAVSLELDGKIVKIGGVAKGSGMIHPNMATMFCGIVTDAAIEKSTLQKMVKEVCDDTFNMITVDGDTSTNDTFMALANGAAKNKMIITEDENYKKFYKAFYYVSEVLAKKIASDGEGSSKFLTVEVKNVKTKEDAKMLAKSICGSNLVKTALFGEDANWGRVLAAAGYSGAIFNIEKVDIYMESNNDKIMVCKDGEGVEFNEYKASKILKEDSIKYIVDVKDGQKSAVAWSCDITYEYVKITGEYRRK